MRLLLVNISYRLAVGRESGQTMLEFVLLLALVALLVAAAAALGLPPKFTSTLSGVGDKLS